MRQDEQGAEAHFGFWALTEHSCLSLKAPGRGAAPQEPESIVSGAGGQSLSLLSKTRFVSPTTGFRPEAFFQVGDAKPSVISSLLHPAPCSEVLTRGLNLVPQAYLLSARISKRLDFS